MSESTATIRDDILQSVTDIFGIEIDDYRQIDQGYLNLKWKIETDIGSLFAKQYNKNRYPEHLVQGLEISLSHQNDLYNQGIPVPQLFQYQGQYVLRTPSQERYVLMRSCQGEILQPGTANAHQMYSLGKITGHMHKLLNSHRAKQPLHWNIRSKEEMLKHWERRWSDAVSMGCEKTLAALEIQRDIIDETDIGLFSGCEQGWCHWDLFVDNILFTPNSVSAVLDFDRLNYVYPDFDISRPILSCALEKGGIRLDVVRAFVHGYREHRPLTLDQLVRSIQLTWWKEAGWVTVEKERDSTPIKRFREENLWVGQHWHHLRDILGGI
ncbi:phosphotransferase [Paenibacillus sp. S28]|uniref:phosphotransferase n=1 Tax=Paenibacillus sp. S28 TaxID=2767463 RepID=UPI00190AABF4|nr:phosphotransferase [Paenibacillus sp. S28]MBJ9987655.1 phosphotransferase [Paenibacillus sp. S28]